LKELTRFKRWANNNRRARGLICHFYKTASKKQYYTDSGYAYFNLFSESTDWIIKGTPGHGIRSERNKVCQTPVFNCYQINDTFYEALESHCTEEKKKYELGLVLSKVDLKRHFKEDNVIDVELWDHQKSRPPPNKCWRYDVWQGRKQLWPFNKCDVVRIRIPVGLYGLPIKAIPGSAVMALLVKEEGFEQGQMLKLLEKKRWNDKEVFPIF
jgi:hypothetical protein